MPGGSAAPGGSGRHGTDRAPHSLQGAPVRWDRARAAGRAAGQRRARLSALGTRLPALTRHGQCQPRLAARLGAASPGRPRRSAGSHGPSTAGPSGRRQKRAPLRDSPPARGSFLGAATAALPRPACAPRRGTRAAGPRRAEGGAGHGPARRTAGAAGSRRGRAGGERGRPRALRAGGEMERWRDGGMEGWRDGTRSTARRKMADRPPPPAPHPSAAGPRGPRLCPRQQRGAPQPAGSPGAAGERCGQPRGRAALHNAGGSRREPFCTFRRAAGAHRDPAPRSHGAGRSRTCSAAGQLPPSTAPRTHPYPAHKHTDRHTDTYPAHPRTHTSPHTPAAPLEAAPPPPPRQAGSARYSQALVTAKLLATSRLSMWGVSLNSEVEY